MRYQIIIHNIFILASVSFFFRETAAEGLPEYIRRNKSYLQTRKHKKHNNKKWSKREKNKGSIKGVGKPKVFDQCLEELG